MSKRPLFFVFLLVCSGIWISEIFHIPFLFENIYPANHIKNFTPVEPAGAALTGIIITDPVSENTEYGRIKTTFTLKALTLNMVRGLELASKQVAVCGLVNVVSFDDRDADLKYGDYILIKGALSRPGSLLNPGLFSYRDYLAISGIFSVVTVKKGDFISLLREGCANRAIKKIFAFKHKLKTLIRRYLHQGQAAILEGVLLGERSQISDNLKDIFVKTGTMHVLIISGLNIGLIASIFVLVLRFLWLPRYIAYPAAAILLIAYSVLTGANIPVVRATIMAVAMLIGMAFSRKVDMLNCLGLGGIVVLLKNPAAIFDASFQLSFGTVVSIVIFAPKFEQFLGASQSQNRFVKYLGRSIAVSLAAWIAIIPIIAHNFNIISWICVIANIPVVFISSVLVAGGFVFLTLGLIAPFLAEILGLATGFLADILIKSVTLFSAVPFGFFWTHKWGVFEILSFYFALAAVAMSLYRKGFRKSYITIAVLLFVNVFLWQDILQGMHNELRITVLDVGHGDAIVVEFPKTGCALIDAGQARGNMDIGEDVVGPYLRSRRIHTIDAVFITHTDNDHRGGLKAVVKDFKARNIFGAGYRLLKRFDRVVGFKNAEVLVLNPPSEGFFGQDTNNNSLVIKITTASQSFIFCGDIKEEAMKNLLLDPERLKSDCIKIPHHGSAISAAGEAFIRAVSPKIALISAASKDVSRSLLNFLCDINCRVYQTHSDGAITLKSSNGAFSVEGVMRQ
jgi:competence protein ComEC